MPSSVAANLARLSDDLSKLDKVIVKATAKSVTDELRKQADRDTGGDGRLSGFGKKAAYLDVEERPIARGVRLLPAKRTYGQWLIVEQGAKPHDVTAKLSKITGKKATTRRRQRDFFQAYGTRGVGVYSGAKPLRTPWGPRYRLTKPTRSRAKRTWTKARGAGLDKAVDVARRELHKVVAG